MTLIKNFDALNKTPQRKICLELINTALSSIQPLNVMRNNFVLKENVLRINDETFNLKNFERIFLIGFGKGSARLSKHIENILGNLLTEGYVIDLPRTTMPCSSERGFSEDTRSEVSNAQTVRSWVRGLQPESRSVGTKIQFTTGTHPLPSQDNFNFTQNIISRFSKLCEKDLVLVVICGGGSAMLVHPHNITLEEKIKVDKALLKSGANIMEMNTVRQHLSDVKGGSLAQILYPSTIVSLISSDVPGNNISYIASGPTAKDNTTIADAVNILKKYNLEKELNLPRDSFVENPKEDKYFEKVKNIIMLSNQTALNAMQKKAQELGFQSRLYSNKFECNADDAGKILINETKHNEILLVGGETTVKVLNSNGKGGRNQELVLAALPFVNDNITIVSFATDGWDNTEFAGAIGDMETIKKAKELAINPNDFLKNNNSLSFFEKTGDGIITGRLPSNVSDIMIVLKK